MKALTIHQPFAHLIVTPQDELPPGATQKLVENRKWSTEYRGPLLIHAGRSLTWFDEEDWPPTPDRKLAFEDFPEMSFGAIVGVAELVACQRFASVWEGECPHVPANHPHAEGPWCWILTNARRFEKPIPYRGQQGLFDVPEELITEAIR